RPEVALGHRPHWTPEPVHVVTIEAPGTANELGWIGQMGQPVGVNPYLQRRESLDQRAAPPGVVEVNVRQEHRPWFSVQRCQEGIQAARRAWIDKHSSEIPAA